MPQPVRMGDEIWIYYSGTNRDHDGSIGWYHIFGMLMDGMCPD